MVPATFRPQLVLLFACLLAPAALGACDADADPASAPPSRPPAPMIEAPPRPALACPGERCTGTLPAPRAHARNLARNGKHTRGTNTQLSIPQNLQLADIDADGYSDFIQYASNKIFVSRTDFARTGILHLYTGRPIKRILTGDFHGDRYDQTCVITDDNRLACYGPSPDKKDLWWWFTQGSFLGDNEDAITGDFDGDGREDVLVYPRGGGAYRMYSMKGDHFFAPTPAFSSGNLGTAAAGLRLRAGDFDGDGRDDLMIVNDAGQIVYYASVFDGTSHTFWWGWSSAGGVVAPGIQVTTARIDDDNTDDVALHDQAHGSTRFLRMVYGLPPLNVKRGQLSDARASLLFWGALHGPVSERGNTTRDDAMVFDLSTRMFVRSDARWDGFDLTYWWAYSQVAPDNHYGWAPFLAKPALVLKCKLAGVAAQPGTDQFYRDLIFGALVPYWRDISYGSWDMSGSVLDDTWHQTSATTDPIYDREARSRSCLNEYQGAKIGFPHYITFINAEGDSGNSAGNLVAVTPITSSLTFLGHETAHSLGWDHSWDNTQRRAGGGPGEYWDFWDIMSAMNVHTFAHPQGRDSGPEMNAPYKTRAAFIPPQRIVRLVPSFDLQTWHASIAAINRPEGNGALMVRIGNDDRNYYTVEYRMPGGWDQGIPRATVLIHQVVDGVSILLTENTTTGAGAERLVGSTRGLFTGTHFGSVTVNAFAGDGYTADVTIDY